MKHVPLGKLHCAYGGEQVSVLNRIYSGATVLLATAAAQMQIVYAVLTVWDAVKYWSAGLVLTGPEQAA